MLCGIDLRSFILSRPDSGRIKINAIIPETKPRHAQCYAISLRYPPRSRTWSVRRQFRCPCGQRASRLSTQAEQSTGLKWSRVTGLLLVGALRAAADDLDLVCHNRVAAVVHLERDILDQEGPHFVTEAVGIERTLSIPKRGPCQRPYLWFHLDSMLRSWTHKCHAPGNSKPPKAVLPTRKARGIHLERQPGLDFLLKRLGHDTVKLVQNLDCKLRIDALSTDEVVQRIGQRDAEAAITNHSELASRILCGANCLQYRRDRRDVPSMTIEIVEVRRVGRHRVGRSLADGGSSCDV